MKLLIIVLALLAARYLHIGRSEQRYSSLLKITSKWLSWLQGKGIKNISVLLILLVLPYLIFIYGLEFLTHAWLFGFFLFLFNLVLFWFILWPIPSEQLKVEGFDAPAQDKQSEKIIINNQGEILKADASSGTNFNQAKKILIEANQNTFAVIFWFMVFGIYGALIYRIINLLYRNSLSLNSMPEFKMLLNLLQQCIDWIPARLVSLGYVLAGDFVPGFQAWRQYAHKGLNANDDILTKTGFNTSGYNPDKSTAQSKENHILYRLVDRTLIVWLFLLAVMVLAQYMT
jgi:AmpE protein